MFSDIIHFTDERKKNFEDDQGKKAHYLERFRCNFDCVDAKISSL